MEKFDTIEKAQAAYDLLADKHQNVVAELKAVTKQNKDLDAAHAKLSEDLKSVKADSSEKDELIQQIRAAKTPAGKPSFKRPEGIWEINVPSFNWQGKVITAKDICDSKKLQDELIAAQVGVLALKSAD